MPNIEFHILSEAGDMARMRHACQLVEEAYSQHQRIVIQVSDSSEAQKLDDMLWTFRDQAFIPHEIATPSSPTDPHVMALIGIVVPAGFSNHVINVSNALPENLETFEHIIEVVDADPLRKQQARERYKQYRERGCQLETKNL